MRPVVGFIGMTHLGLVSGISAAEKGFQVVCFDPDESRIALIKAGTLPVSEPQLDDLLARNAMRLSFSSSHAALQDCDLVYVAPDVATDEHGSSDLAVIDGLLDLAFQHSRSDAVIVVLSQVPPGFTRARQRPGRILYYQVETLIFGRAVERALFPERYIVGCSNATQALPAAFKEFLDAHGCPVLSMRYESAELAKISINMCLVASVSTANTLAELCEKLGADWSEIVPALKLDKRIGQYSYLAPGLGIAGGNLERDLATVCRLSDNLGTDAGVVRAWLSNSRHRRDWAANTIQSELLDRYPDAQVAIWGLAYKENTHSTKNSPSLATIALLPKTRLRLHDPLVPTDSIRHPFATGCATPLQAVDQADALLILTPWPQYREISAQQIVSSMKGRMVLDPYAVLDRQAALDAGLNIYTLGCPPLPSAGNI